MPVLLRNGGYRFECYASDAGERRHIHVKTNGKHAKIWLEPVISLAFSGRFQPHEMNAILRLVQRHRDRFVEQINDFFRG